MENYTLTKDSGLVRECSRVLQKTIDEAVKSVNAISPKWRNTVDLKLHDACALSEIDVIEDGYKIVLNDDKQRVFFDMFCGIEFEDFKCNLRAHDIDFEEFIHRVGRTSQFYVGGYNYCHDDKITYLLAYISEDFNLAENLITSEEGGKITLHMEDSFDYFEDVYQYCYDCLAIAENLTADVKEWVDKVNYMYDYIENFKNNQNELFSEFVLDNIMNQ